MKKILTLAYLVTEDRICLAMKKRGFGEGNWNGYGGKLEEGEPVHDAAIREIREESGVEVTQDALEKVAEVEFFFVDGKHLEVHTFFVRSWSGEPKETEEMRPEWFPFAEIPYKNMWADDEYWLPRALQGEKFLGKVWFKEDDKSIEHMEWTPTKELNELTQEQKNEFRLK